MTVVRLAVLIAVTALTAMGQQDSAEQALVPPSCPVTVAPAEPFRLPAAYGTDNVKNTFWFGTEKLWTNLRKSGVWWWAPRPPGHEQDVQPLTTKLFWWSVNFSWKNELRPDLIVTGKRLDGDAPALLTLPSTHAIMGTTGSMLSGVYVPAPGCWEITGDYKGEKLSFVVWVEPAKHVKPVKAKE